MLSKLKNILVFLFILQFYNLSAGPQIKEGKDYNPEKLMAESKDLNEKSNVALMKASIFQQEGTLFLDSARLLSNFLRTYPTNENYNRYYRQLETHYTLAYKYIAIADSIAIVAENFREMSINKLKEAYAMMGKDVEIVQTPVAVTEEPVKNGLKNPEPVPAATENKNKTAAVKKNTEITRKENGNKATIIDNNISLYNENTLFVIQLGAGRMDMGYFSKVPDIKTINCRDGVNRYVLPEYYSKADANRKRDELTRLGYEQIFIRTKESLDKIAD